ncbi:pentatricopeptide repeat-containing protein At1g08070, chloroplastic-like [Papaver somniferum]|uniref:pentatricopeptide repeat-containing protein At1g08070, chloroplastic-like n=1 Tax=Papaver somniferum TaxID=3469 RepID=UPI000E6FDF3E|nr:pentatricopeptide repeat-containing protein At1g08070, chloroplastic-like [Papaver somniferum]
MKDRGVEKTPGCSSIEVNGFIHEFVSGEKTHPQMEDIHQVLEKMNDQLEQQESMLDLRLAPFQSEMEVTNLRHDPSLIDPVQSFLDEAGKVLDAVSYGNVIQVLDAVSYGNVILPASRVSRGPWY